MKLVDSFTLQELKPYEINMKFRAIKDIINGGVDDDNISSDAGISLTKTTLDRTALNFILNVVTISDFNKYYGVTTTPAPQTITIAETVVRPGNTWIIKDESGGANANNITIVCGGGVTIDGAPNAVINTNYGFKRLYAISTRKVMTI